VKPALILTHLDDRQTGLVRDCLRSAGVAVHELDALYDAELPGVDEISGLVSLGGRASATQVDRDPALGAEVELMAAALADGVPVLGMCLGAQLLAVAAGGQVKPIGRMYVDWPRMSRLSSAQGDPLFGGLPEDLPVLEWHEDMIEPPPGAVELATTPGPGTALFRLSDRLAWGSQAHLEVTGEMLFETWLASPKDAAEIEAAGHDFEEFRAASHEHVEVQMAAARPIFQAFGVQVSRSPAPRSSASARSGSRRR
jgi:GMP synthase-like glutamine amidotransferase